MLLAVALGSSFDKNWELWGSCSLLSNTSYFWKYTTLQSSRALYFNMTDCFLSMGPFHMPLVISRRSCSLNSCWNETCCRWACHFYICTSSNVILPTLPLSHCCPFLRNERKRNSWEPAQSSVSPFWRTMSISNFRLFQDVFRFCHCRRSCCTSGCLKPSKIMGWSHKDIFLLYLCNNQWQNVVP